MHPGHIRPFKVMAMAFLRLANLPTKFIFLYIFFTRCIGQFGLKNASGHRPCPIAYSVFKCVQIVIKI